MSSLMGLEWHWLWLIAGLVLVAVETMAPGLFLLWVGLAALATGLVAWLFPLTITMQLVAFAILGLCSIVLGQKIQKQQKSEATDTPFLNERGKALVGRKLVLETAIANGSGSVRMDDSVWRVTGQDLPAGTTVVVRSIDGSTLAVEKAAS